MPVLKLAVREGPAIWSLLFGNVSWGGLLACRVAALVVIRVDRSQAKLQPLGAVQAELCLRRICATEEGFAGSQGQALLWGFCLLAV